MKKINLLIIGNGHYATGLTSISDQKQTDKDFGVFFPSALALRAEGLVDQIAIAGRDGSKYVRIQDRCKQLQDDFGWKTEVNFYPPDGMVDEKAYIRVLAEMPRPSHEEIRQALTGNLCRCTGYCKVVQAIERAAAAP